MSYDNDYEKFEYYLRDGIDQLRDTEGWSDQKIARFLREEATSLAPRRRTKTIKVPLDKILKQMEEMKPQQKNKDECKHIAGFQEIIDESKRLVKCMECGWERKEDENVFGMYKIISDMKKVVE